MDDGKLASNARQQKFQVSAQPVAEVEQMEADTHQEQISGDNQPSQDDNEKRRGEEWTEPNVNK